MFEGSASEPSFPFNKAIDNILSTKIKNGALNEIVIIPQIVKYHTLKEMKSNIIN